MFWSLICSFLNTGFHIVATLQFWLDFKLYLMLELRQSQTSVMKYWIYRLHFRTMLYQPTNWKKWSLMFWELGFLKFLILFDIWVLHLSFFSLNWGNCQNWQKKYCIKHFFRIPSVSIHSQVLLIQSLLHQGSPQRNELPMT